MRRCTSRNIRLAAVIFAVASVVVSGNESACADEGGVSFWLPGQFASLAAVPATPGFAFGTIYYHPSISAGANEAFVRGGLIDLGVEGSGDLAAFGPTYAFDQKLWGGQPSLGLLGIGGQTTGSVAATLTGPNGHTISGHLTETVAGFGDLYPQASLAWNDGVNNYKFVMSGDIPIGSYDPKRIVNLGLGHGAIDSSGAYTYFNPKSGFELSATTGFTYNFSNPDTNYQNGIDWHLDWGLSKFVSRQLQIELVGYFFQQITGDSGSGAKLGGFESRVAGVGPQVGYIVPLGNMQGYLNLKGYGEFANENRAAGWNIWLTFAISPQG